jgi:PUA-domain protein
MDLEYRHKHRLRQKEINALAIELNDKLGTTVFTDRDNVETAETKGYDIIFVDNAIVGLIIDGKPMLTVHGLLKYNTTRRFVTVDMGAVPYVCNGADVMTPGIIDADALISIDDYVWIRDEKNKKPLAIGRALMTGADLKAAQKGKGIKAIHWVGDELWNLKS